MSRGLQVTSGSVFLHLVRAVEEGTPVGSLPDFGDPGRLSFNRPGPEGVMVDETTGTGTQKTLNYDV